MALAVNDRSPAIVKLARHWAVTEPLMEGTLAMRDAGEALLPRFANEDVAAHQTRLKLTTLFPAFKRTVLVMAGKPFSKLAILSEDCPVEIKGQPADPKVPGSEAIEGWADNIDREGVNLHSFASEMLIEALAHGLCGILVEAPRPITGANGVPTRKEQAKAGVRPYWVRIKHNQILGYQISRENGPAVLTQLRLAETAEVADGPWGTKTVNRVRVLTPGAWEVWEQNGTSPGKDAEWAMIDSGQTVVPYISFVPLYGFRRGLMDGESPLLELAYSNVKHWQSQSDQDNMLHFARQPILVATGFADTDDIAIGAATAIKTSNENAKVTWTELQGQSIAEGRTSLAALEEQMIQAGAELLTKKPGSRTATETSNDAEANKADLQRIVETFEDALDTALKMTADYSALPCGGKVTLFKDFGAALLTDASAQLVVNAQQSGLISKVTAITELQRRGTLSADIDADDEAEKVAAEGMGLGAMEDDQADPETETGGDDAPGMGDRQQAA